MAHHHLAPARIPVNPALWSNGLSNNTPQVGDLYVVGYDGQDYGLVLIAAVRDSHVVVWPVTDESLSPSDTCFKLQADWLDEPLVCWPEAEAGVSYASLDRRLGHPVDDRTMLAIYFYLRGEDQPDDVEFYPHREDDSFFDALDAVCEYAGDLSDHDWPDPSETVGILNPNFVRERHLTPADVRDVVRETVPRVIQEVLEGRRLLSPEQARDFAARFQSPIEDVLAPPRGGEVIELRQPSRKHRIRTIAATHHQTENQVRFAAWSKTQTAARQSGAASTEAIAARVDQALAELEASPA
jgi:hypothetical protein